MWVYLWHVVEYITIYLVFTTDRCAHMYIYFLILWDDTNKKIVKLLSLNVKTRSWLRTTIYMLLFRIGFMWIVCCLWLWLQRKIHKKIYYEIFLSIKKDYTCSPLNISMSGVQWSPSSSTTYLIIQLVTYYITYVVCILHALCTEMCKLKTLKHSGSGDGGNYVM